MKDNKKHLKPEILAVVKRHGNVAKACRQLKLTRQCVYLWTKQDKDFAKDFSKAVRVGRDAMRDFLAG